MALTATQFTELDAAIRDAFRTRALLDRVLILHFGMTLDVVASTGSYLTDVTQAINYFDSEDRLDEFVAAAIQESTNLRLRAFYDSADATLALPSKPKLESIIRGSGGFVDVEPFLEWVISTSPKVCRIEFAHDKGGGTGFLVGRDLVMTNFHVMQAVIPGGSGVVGAAAPIPAGDAIFRFDYKKLADGTKINDGKTYRLQGNNVDDWLVASSRWSDVDTMAAPGDRVPAGDELDFVLLRIDGPAADDVIRSHGSKAPRGWLTPPVPATDLEEGSPMFILQHPQQRPLQWAYDPDALEAYNANRTRLWHRVNTEPGSSGSPCFDHRMNLVALHHSGDPMFKKGHNEGIPIDTIYSFLATAGVALS